MCRITVYNSLVYRNYSPVLWVQEVNMARYPCDAFSSTLLHDENLQVSLPVTFATMLLTQLQYQRKHFRPYFKIVNAYTFC